jgi:extracellular elastinolytic metalloproteinase
MVSQADGTTLKALAPGTPATLREKAVQPTPLDGDLDSDIIFHEYGHGLTWRMIGHMNGTLAGAVGEGASDTLAFLINGDDLIAEYASPGGIRRAPYSGYSALRTYADWTADQVHNDGEIYAAAMWRVLELYQADGKTAEDVMATWVDGMNFTPASPAPEDMRDGMLASATIHAPDEVCLIWEGFAELGIGLGAHGKQGDSFKIVESFEVPAECE